MKVLIIGLALLFSAPASAEDYSSVDMKQAIAFCTKSYQHTKAHFTHVRAMQKYGSINEEQVEYLMEMGENTLKSTDLVCQFELGKKAAEKLKASILD